MNLTSWVQIHGPVVARRDHSAATSARDSAVRKGLLTAVLPGVYLLASVAADLKWRIAAVMAWRPDAVICGTAAAWLTFWPELRVDTIDVATRCRSSRPGFRFHRGAIPLDLISVRHGSAHHSTGADCAGSGVAVRCRCDRPSAAVKAGDPRPN